MSNTASGPCDWVERIFATNPNALQARANAKAKMFNPIAGSEAAFGMEAVCFADGLISPTAFRASRMRASVISVVEEELELHSEEPQKKPLGTNSEASR